MLTSIVVRIVGFCIRRAWAVVGLSLLIAVGSSAYVATHFRLNSDIDALLPSSLDWRKRDLAFERAFDRFGIIDVVVTAPTPELTGAATVALTQAFESGEGAVPTGLERRRHGVLLAARTSVLVQGGAGEGSCRSHPGRSADSGSRCRPQPARVGRRARGRAARSAVQSPAARRSRSAFESGGEHAGRRARGASREFLVARFDARKAGGPARSARRRRGPSGARFQRSPTRPSRQRGHSPDRGGHPAKLSGEPSSHRRGDDERRTVRDDQGECGSQRGDHSGDRRVHSLARPALGTAHGGSRRQSLRRPRRDGGSRPAHGRRLQSHLNLLFRALRRHRRGFRHPVQRSLPLRTPRDRQSRQGD